MDVVQFGQIHLTQARGARSRTGECRRWRWGGFSAAGVQLRVWRFRGFEAEVEVIGSPSRAQHPAGERGRGVVSRGERSDLISRSRDQA